MSVRPLRRETRPVNETGIGLMSPEGERIIDIRLYEENGSIQLWFETADFEAFQYLSPQQAMQFSIILERLAQSTMRKSAEFFPQI